jgi:hypothetical protein
MNLRLIMRFLSAVLIAVGTGFVVYGSSVDPQHYRAPAGIQMLGNPSETTAWGAGFLVAGVLFLFLFGFKAPVFDKPGRP